MKLAKLIGAIILGLALASPSALAQEPIARIVVVGNGEARSAPEFTRLSVNVISICFDSSQAARNANARLANEIVELFRELLDQDAPDRVVTRPGASVIQSETVWSEDERRVICERKWRFTNTVSIELRDIDVLAELQDRLTMIIDVTADIDPDLAAQTYGEIDPPSFHLYPETLREMRSSAQRSAYDDARHQYDALSQRCHFEGTRLIRVAPPSYDVSPMFQGEALKLDAASSETPILPDELSVSVSLEFIWSFVDSDCN